MRRETMEHIVLSFYVVAIMIPLGQLLIIQSPTTLMIGTKLNSIHHLLNPIRPPTNNAKASQSEV